MADHVELCGQATVCELVSQFKVTLVFQSQLPEIAMEPETAVGEVALGVELLTSTGSAIANTLVAEVPLFIL